MLDVLYCEAIQVDKNDAILQQEHKLRNPQKSFKVLNKLKTEVFMETPWIAKNNN